MKKAFWFSRHRPTEAQVSEFEGLSYDLVANDASYQLGSMSIGDNRDVKAVVSGILAQCAAIGADICAGVFPTPIAEAAMRTADDAIQDGDYRSGTVAMYAAWNVMRSVDGGKPTFEHRQFCRIGIIHADALRWY